MNLSSFIREWLQRSGPARRNSRSQTLCLTRAQMVPTADLARSGPVIRTARDLAHTHPDLVRSAIRKGFNATQPVTCTRNLHGREEQMEQLIDGVLDRCKHALIHGPRGCGKTSLARVFANVADDRGLIVLYSACEPEQDLHQILSPFLAAVLPAERQQEDAAGQPPSTREIVDLLAAQANRRYIFILDEFDRVTNIAVQHELARLMKMLSDAAIPVNIVAVGIGSSLDIMIEGHASLRRHLTPVAVAGIEPDAVIKLIERGSKATGLPFTDAAREMIAPLSCGSPYHVRLFCALSSLEAVRRQQPIVDVGAAVAGISRAVSDWSQTNDSHAALFRKAIALGPAHWDMIGLIAREVAVHGAASLTLIQGEQGHASELVHLLRDALEWIGDSGDRFAFRDSLAPQFLLAMLFATQNSDNADHKIVSIVDPLRQTVVH